MKPLIAVIRREYLQRVRNKWFIISTLGVPLLMIAAMAIPIVLAARREAGERKIAVVDRTGVLEDRVVERLGTSFEVERVEYSSDVASILDGRVEVGEVAGYLMLDEETLASGRAVFRGDGTPGSLRRIRLQRAVVESVLEVRLAQVSGVDGLQELLSGGSIDYQSIKEDEPDQAERAAAMAIGFAGAMVLYMAIFIYGVQVMRAVLEEKTTRIVEVIISAMKPWQLMLGKILGVGAVGLTQLGIWFLSAALLLSFGLPYLVAARPELLEFESALEYLPAAGGIALFLAFFVLGYFLFSSLFAAVGAMCSTDEEAQQTLMPVMMLVIIPIMFLAPVIEDPNGPLATWLSLFPFFSPILMFPRFMGGAPLWQAGLSLVLVVLTILVVASVAGRIYRVGILMQGKRPTLPELVRWVREA